MSTRARVRLTVEVSTSDSWGDDCTIGQARKQAKDSAVCSLLRALADDRESGRFRVMGEPVVEVIIVEDNNAK